MAGTLRPIVWCVTCAARNGAAIRSAGWSRFDEASKNGDVDRTTDCPGAAGKSAALVESAELGSLSWSPKEPANLSRKLGILSQFF